MKAFVIMSFSSEFDDVYNLGIKPACKNNKISESRLDEQIFDEGMLDKIYFEILSSDIVIAELTEKNPNVFYELGYAHGLEKKCVLLTQDVSNIPFDLKLRRHEVYNSVLDLKNKLSNTLKYLKTEMTNFNKNIKLDVTLDGYIGYDHKIFEYAKIDLVLRFSSLSNRPIKNIHTLSIYFNTDWKITFNKNILIPNESDDNKFKYKFIIQSPSSTLTPGGWTPLVFNLEKFLRVLKSEELHNSELASKKITGQLLCRLDTDQGSFDSYHNIDLTIEEDLPF